MIEGRRSSLYCINKRRPQFAAHGEEPFSLKRPLFCLRMEAPTHNARRFSKRCLQLAVPGIVISPGMTRDMKDEYASVD